MSTEQENILSSESRREVFQYDERSVLGIAVENLQPVSLCLLKSPDIGAGACSLFELQKHLPDSVDEKRDYGQQVS